MREEGRRKKTYRKREKIMRNKKYRKREKQDGRGNIVRRKREEERRKREERNIIFCNARCKNKPRKARRAGKLAQAIQLAE